MNRTNQMRTPFLSVALRAYNQEKEIVRALDSVIKQNVFYDVELVIGVDQSSDNTLAVVEKYCSCLPDGFSYKIIAHKSNIGGAANWVSVMTSCNGKYIAVLDGDDYWIDPEKSNKQIEILDQYPEIGLVYADCYLEDEFGKLYQNPSLDCESNIFSQMLRGNICISGTVMFRNDIQVDYEPLLHFKWKNDDYYTWLEIASNYSFFHLRRYVSVYTRTYNLNEYFCSESAMGSDRDMRQCVELCNYFIQRYPDKTDVTYNDLLISYHKEVVKTGIKLKNFDYCHESVLELSDKCVSFADKLYFAFLRHKTLFHAYLLYRDIKRVIRVITNK